jgi:hypothetical protein
MAVLTESEMSNLALDAIQANVATDPPFTAAEVRRHLNNAIALVYEIEGGSIKRVASATAWSVAQSADTTGKLTGILTDIKEVLRLFSSSVSGSTGAAGDVEMDRAELSKIEWLRTHGAGLGTYTTPKLFAVTRLATATPGDINKVTIDYWPGVSGLYFPLHYVPQFTLLDGASVTTPDLTDLGSRDAAYLAAAEMAPLNGRAELVPSIMTNVSEHTRLAVERKRAALQSGDHDR